MQEEKPVVYFSRKLTPAQQNYRTMEKELLAIVSTLLEFCSMLLGAKIFVFIDHKNLTFKNLNSSCVLRWRLFLEDFDCTFAYVAGRDNVLGDAFSRLPQTDDADSPEGKTSLRSIEDLLLFSLTDHAMMLNCFLNLSAPQQMRYPMDLQWIQENQFDDDELNNARQHHPLNFPAHTSDGVPLLCYRHNHLEEQESNWQIWIPSGLLQDMVLFFHKILGHVGEVRAYDSICAQFHHPKLKSIVESICKDCNTCRKHKLQGPGYRELSARHVTARPWEEVHVDLIRPWAVQVNGNRIEVNTPTCINPVTILVELI